MMFSKLLVFFYLIFNFSACGPTNICETGRKQSLLRLADATELRIEPESRSTRSPTEVLIWSKEIKKGLVTQALQDSGNAIIECSEAIRSKVNGVIIACYSVIKSSKMRVTLRGEKECAKVEYQN